MISLSTHFGISYFLTILYTYTVYFDHTPPKSSHSSLTPPVCSLLYTSSLFLGNSQRQVSPACCDIGCFSQLNLVQALSSHLYMDFLRQMFKILDITQISKSFLYIFFKIYRFRFEFQISFELVFTYDEILKFIFLYADGWPVIPAPSVEEIAAPLLHFPWTLVHSQLELAFQIHSSFPLFYFTSSKFPCGF